jgi:hypothetical protein
MVYIESRELELMQLALGASILNHSTLSKLMSRDRKVVLFETTKNHITAESPAPELEQASAIISALASDDDEEIRVWAINFTRRIPFNSFPAHVIRLVTPLVPNFDDLRSDKDTPVPTICARLAAMANFSPEHDSDILDICSEYLNRRDQVFLSVIELFNAKPSILKSRPSFVNSILTATDLTWVQQNTVVKLLGVLNELDFRRDCPRYVSLTLDLTISAALSPQTVVSQTGRTSLSQFAGLRHCDAIAIRLFRADWFTPKTIDLILLLLNSIVDEFNFQKFIPLSPLVTDVLLAFPEHAFVPNGFRFLAFFPPSRRLSDLCLSRIQQLFWSFTQRRLLPARSVAFDALGPLLGATTTDVAASDVLWTGAVLDPLRHCLAYFASQPSVNVASAVLHLCPREALRIAGHLRVELPPAAVAAVLDRVREPGIIARCVRFLAGRPTDAAKVAIGAIVQRGLVARAVVAYEIVRFVEDVEGEEVAA